MSFWEMFSTQFQKSNVISGALALMIWGGILYLSIVGHPIPEILYAGGTAVITAFIAAKAGQSEGYSRAISEMTIHEERRTESGN